MEIVTKIKNLFTSSGRNIVFFFDGDQTFKEELEAIAAAGIQTVEVRQNYFYLKYQLEFEWQDEQVFLYHGFAKPDEEAFRTYPLLDLLLANTELKLDDVSEFMAEYQLPDMHYPLVKKYIKQLKTKTNQKKLARILDPTQFSEQELLTGLLSITLDFTTVVSRNACMAKWLQLATTETDFQRVNEAIKKLELEKLLVHWYAVLLETKGQELNEDLAKEIARKLKYNVLTATLTNITPQDTYAGLKLTRTVEINKVMNFFQDWLQNPILKNSVDPVFNELGGDIRISSLLEWYGTEQEYGYYTEEMIGQVLQQLYEGIHTNTAAVEDQSIKWLKSDWFSENQRQQITFLYYTSSMLSLLDSYRSFIFNKPEAYIERYQKELYKVDTNFRKAVIAFNKVRDHLYENEEQAEKCFELLNSRYDRYLIDLNVEWQKLLEKKQFNLHEIKVAKQYDFFKNNIENIDHKMVVIISDAFRYELGVDLYNQLIVNSKNTITLEPYLASIPSYTNLGMANLLPNKGLKVEKGENDLTFKIQDKTTASTNRAAILQTVEKESTAVDYSQVIRWSRDEGRSFFSANRLVYIYHDWIDSVGDKRRTEHETFEATTKAIENIDELIQKLYNWNVYHILVTSDHGFLFNYKELTESSRESLPRTNGYCKDHTRFVITDDPKVKSDGYVMNMQNTSSADTDLKIVIPRAINRFRKQGNVGVQFVHGGASLQELIVPVLKFYKQKKEISQPVTFRRFDKVTKITTGSVKVGILQEQPVSNEYKEAHLKIGLYSDTGELLSNEEKLLINSTSANPKERTYELILTLNSKGSKVNFCYLKAFDQKDKDRLNPIRINDLITISSLMGKDDF